MTFLLKFIQKNKFSTFTLINQKDLLTCDRPKKLFIVFVYNVPYLDTERSFFDTRKRRQGDSFNRFFWVGGQKNSS